jgi:hypothetical protein
MSRDNSTAAWTPDWLGESPETADHPADDRPTGPAHAAPEPHRGADSETREPIDLGAFEQAERQEFEQRGHTPPESRRALVSQGWAEEREPRRADRPGDLAVGSLRSLGAVAVTGRRPTRPPAAPRQRRATQGRTKPAYGLLALVLLALASAFFAWVTAEPVWLALGHAEPGTVTVTTCRGDRCLGTFAGAGFARAAVPVMGDAPDPGQSAPAEMTSSRGTRAYVGVDAAGRAGAGVGLIVLCGLGIVRATGVRRLASRPARRTATLLSLAGPLMLLVAMLAVTY